MALIFVLRIDGKIVKIKEPLNSSAVKLSLMRNETYHGINGAFVFDVKIRCSEQHLITDYIEQFGVDWTDDNPIELLVYDKEIKLNRLLAKGNLLLHTAKTDYEGLTVSVAPDNGTTELLDKFSLESDLSVDTSGPSFNSLLRNVRITTPAYTAVTAFTSQAGDILGCITDLKTTDATNFQFQMNTAFNRIFKIQELDDLFMVNESQEQLSHTNESFQPVKHLLKANFTADIEFCFDINLRLHVDGVNYGDNTNGPAGPGIGPCQGTAEVLLQNFYQGLRIQRFRNNVFSDVSLLAPTVINTQNCVLGTYQGNNDWDCNKPLYDANGAELWKNTFNYSVSDSLVLSVVEGDEYVFSLVCGGSFISDPLSGPFTAVKFCALLESTGNCSLSARRILQEEPKTVSMVPAVDIFKRTVSQNLLTGAESVDFTAQNMGALQDVSNGSTSNMFMAVGKMLRGAELSNIPANITCFMDEFTATAEPQWKMSVAAFFENINKMFCCGIEITNQNNVRLERRAYFYQDGLTIPLFKLNKKEAKFTRVFLDKFRNKTISIGYDVIDDKHFHYRHDVFGKRKYYTGKGGEDIDLVSSWCASPYTAFRNFEAGSNGTADFDKETFCFLVDNYDSTDYKNISDTIGPGSVGLISPVETFINTGITPRRNWCRHARFIYAADVFNQYPLGGTPNEITGYDGASFEIAGGSFVMNYKAKDKDFKPIDYFSENLLGTYSPFPQNHERIYKPYEIGFSVTLCPEQWQLLKENPYGRIGFEDEHGNIYTGWITSADYTPVAGICEFKIIESNLSV